MKKKTFFNFMNCKKIVSSIFLLIFIFSLSVGIFLPQPAKAIPVEDIMGAPIAVGNWVWSKMEAIAKEIYNKTGSQALNAAIKYSLNTIAYDTATWLGSGGHGQKPMFITEGWEPYLRNTADNAAGIFIESLGKSGSYAKFNLCEPNLNVQIAIGLGLKEYARPTPPTCTFTKMRNNWEQELLDKKFLEHFQTAFDPTNSDLGIALTLNQNMIEDQNKKQNEAANKRLANNGWLDVTKLVSGDAISVPGYGKMSTESSLQGYVASLNKYTGNALVDAANTFLNTYAITLLKTKLSKIGGAHTTSPSSFLDSLTNKQASPANSGMAGTQASIRKIIQPSFGEQADYDVLSKLSSCPNPAKAGPTDCVLDNKFFQAIQNKITVGQALKEGYLNPSGVVGFNAQGTEPAYNQGFPYRSLVILRKYRIIPIGWELAAQYVKDSGLAQSVTIQNLVNCFSNTDDYVDINYDGQDWCKGLVDPNWVLKAPQEYCKKIGPGPEIMSSQTMQQGTSSVLMISRNDQYCADEQSCIQENKDGSCNIFGYCTEEKRQWKFKSDSCNATYNTCQSYKSSDGQTASYLANSLDYENCTADNAGCNPYCTEYNPSTTDMEITFSQPGFTPFNLPIATTYTGNAGVFYNNNMPGASFNNPIFSPSLQNQASNIILYYNNQTDKFYLVLVHGATAGGIAGTAHFAFLNITSTGGNDVRRFYAQNGSVAPPAILNSGDDWQWQWIAGSTEGGVIELPNSNWSITIDPTANWNGINSWRVLYEAGGTVQARILDDRNQAVTISRTAGSGSWFCTAAAGAKKYFTSKIAKCEAEQEGCHELIRTKEDVGANLIINGSFENAPNTSLGTAFGPGAFAIENWPFSTDYQVTLTDRGSGSQVYDGNNSLHWQGGATGGITINIPVNQGLPMPNNFSMAPNIAYTFSAWVYPLPGSSPVTISMHYQSGANTIATSTQGTGQWERIMVTGLSDSGDPINSLELEASGGEFYLDAIRLEKNSRATAYSEYRNRGLVYEKLIPDYFMKACYELVNGYYERIDGSPSICDSFARQCSPLEEGCNMYTSQTDNFSIPGKIGVNNYCVAACVGYDKYLQTETSFESTQVSRLIPKNTPKCSASAVGCDEFTNLDKLSQGGEAKEYYTYLRQCRKPDTIDCQSSGTCQCAGFYTWEGSEEAGYQLHSYTLQANANAPFTYGTLENGIPCNVLTYNLITNPNCREFFNNAGQNFYAYYNYTVTCAEDCHPFRRTEINIVKNPVTEEDISENECNALSTRSDQADVHYDAANLECVFCKDNGVWDDPSQACIYSAIPGEGQKCSAAQMNCREYTGNRGANEQMLLRNSFESGTLEGWTGNIDPGQNPSNNSLMLGGHSLFVSFNNTGNTYTISKNIGYLVRKDKSYTLSFLTDSSVNLSAWIGNSTGASSTFYNLTITPEEAAIGWNHFRINLPQLDHDVQGDETLVILGTSPYFIDDITLTETTDRYYLIKPTLADIPEACFLDYAGENVGPDFNLGCDKYMDPDNKAYYLNGFNELCPESAVGCELMVDTHNSTDPATTTNPAMCLTSQSDCIETPADSFIYAVFNKDKKCNAVDKGCTRLGQEYTYENQAIYSTVYLKDNPDKYESTTCTADAVGCQTWQADNSTVYFKDPGGQTCEWRQWHSRPVTSQNVWSWFKTSVNRCDSNADGRASNADRICNTSGDCGNNGVICNSDGQCGANLACVNGVCHNKCIGDSGDYECANDYDGTGSNSQQKTLGLDDNHLPVKQPVADNNGLNWVGLCPAEQSSCTEFIDPLTRFNTNLVRNPQIDNTYILSNPNLFNWLPANAGGGTYHQIIRITEGNSLYRVNVFGGTDIGGNQQTLTYYVTGCTSVIYPYEVQTNRVGVGANGIGSAVSQFSSFTSPSRVFYVKEPANCTIYINNVSFADTNVNRTRSITINKLETSYQLNKDLDSSACSGMVNYDSGCVLFNERSAISKLAGLTTYKNLIYDADRNTIGENQPPFSVTPANLAEADSNVILKVEPDRRCAKWLSCDNWDPTDKNGNSCSDVGLCDAFGPQGECAHHVTGTASYNPLAQVNSILDNNINRNIIGNMSGYIKVGIMNTGNASSFSLPNDLYPFSGMMPFGETIDSDFNGNFETIGESGVDSRSNTVYRPANWSEQGGGWNADSFSLISSLKQAQADNLAPFSSDLYAPEGRNFLKINSGTIAASPQSDLIRVISGNTYVISAFINTAKLTSANGGNSVFSVSVAYFGANGAVPLATCPAIPVNAGLGWQRYSAVFPTAFCPMPGETQNIRVMLNIGGGGGTAGSVYVDDIKIAPALEIETQPAGMPWYQPSDCRLYPAQDSLSCDYIETDTGIRKRGWPGYCLEYDRYPGNPNACLLWYPVSKIKGDNLIDQSNYSERAPLYYCTGITPTHCATGTLAVNADDIINSWFNGDRVTPPAPVGPPDEGLRVQDGGYYASVNLRPGKNVIAVSGWDMGNVDRAIQVSFISSDWCSGGVIAVNTKSLDGWKCTDTEEPGWTNVDFDDSLWPPAGSASNGRGSPWDIHCAAGDTRYLCLPLYTISPTPIFTQGIWAAGAGEGSHSYCRYTMNIHYCTNIAEVVKNDGENEKWNVRANSNSTYTAPCRDPLTGRLIGCPYGANFAPFASILPAVDITTQNIPPIYFEPNNLTSPGATFYYDYQNIPNNYYPFLQRIFARGYQTYVWQGTPNVGSYVNPANATTWASPADICPTLNADIGPHRPQFSSFSGGQLLCLSNSGSSGACTSTANMNTNLQTNDWCAVPPKIQSARINNQTLDPGGNTVVSIPIGNMNNVALTLQVAVDPEQMPLKILRIHWGDEPNLTDSEEISNDSWTLANSAYTVTRQHDYGGYQGTTPPVIRAQVMDNWDWCLTSQNCAATADFRTLGSVSFQ